MATGHPTPSMSFAPAAALRIGRGLRPALALGLLGLAAAVQGDPPFPEVFSVLPADGAQAVSLDQTIEIVFTEVMATAQTEQAVRIEPRSVGLAWPHRRFSPVRGGDGLRRGGR